ncbi:MAG: hypothetical protein DRI70_04430 [Bacteroidetes bacterium]|nr:MAG: hypothetical protein DRI70_04430 [Bacteroidota bacterium]
MKEIFHKIMSAMMAFVVLLSTMSFTIDRHYCGDILVDTAIFKQAKTCGMEKQQSIPTSDCSITKTDCCSDEQITFEGQNELKISFDSITFEQQLFISSFVYSYIDLFNELNKNVIANRDYISPLIVSNIYQLDEVYII